MSIVWAHTGAIGCIVLNNILRPSGWQEVTLQEHTHVQEPVTPM